MLSSGLQGPVLGPILFLIFFIIEDLVLLDLFNELRKRDKCEICLFFAPSLINSIIQEHKINVRFYLSYDI